MMMMLFTIVIMVVVIEVVMLAFYFLAILVVVLGHNAYVDLNRDSSDYAFDISDGIYYLLGLE